MSTKTEIREILRAEAEFHQQAAQALLEAANRLAFCPDAVFPREPATMSTNLAKIRSALLTECWDDPWDQMVAAEAAEALDELERIAF